MKLPDTDVLIYAASKAARQHAAALRWLQDAFDEPAGVGLAWAALLGFVRITTHPRILDRPLSVDNALRTVGFWLDQPNASALGPGERHFELLRRLLRESGGTGNPTRTSRRSRSSTERPSGPSTATSNVSKDCASNDCGPDAIAEEAV